jgi:general secretion pathway protein M
MLQIRRISPESSAPEVAPSPALWQLGIVSWLGRFPVLERRRTEFGHWWGGRTPRERRLLMALAGTAALVLIIVGVYQPLRDVRVRAIADIHTYEVLSAQLRTAGPELARLRAIDRSASPGIISSSASAFGLTLARVDPQEGIIRVALEDADFTKIIQWLVQLESTTTLRVSNIRVDRQPTPGIVDAQIALGR